ncbi:MAG: hypothetical protein NT027_17105 [Proteobacteria bacterium]|nr:hypothetical protein [Pseudomonadota bacterium]
MMAELIRDYTKMTTAAAAQLQRELGVENLLEAWLKRRVPQRGSLSDGSAFQFHGIGCVIERTDDIDLDFDFGVRGRADGFDSWRLWRFAKQFPGKYPELQHLDDVEIALRALSEAGIVCPSGDERDSLLYLRG